MSGALLCWNYSTKKCCRNASYDLDTIMKTSPWKFQNVTVLINLTASTFSLEVEFYSTEEPYLVNN